MTDTLSIISWNVTRRCNLSCNHCYLPACKDCDGSNNDLNTDEALRLIDRISKVNPEVLLILSGGEPLLRNDILGIAGHASSKGMMVVLASNGLLIDNRVASSLRRCGVKGISISIDSANPEIHDEVRSYEGSWHRAVNAVSVCKGEGLSVQINTVVTKKNYLEIPSLIEYAQSLGADVFSPFFLVCTGNGEELTDISPGQYKEVLSSIANTQGRHNGMMIRTRCAPTFRRLLHEINPESMLLKMQTGCCLAGRSYCRITPEGDVTPCPYMPLPAGNVRQTDFVDIWNSSDLFLSLRNPSLKGRCKDCEFSLICGGCRARAFSSSRDYLDEDPWCDYVPRREGVLAPPSFESGQASMVTHGLTPKWTKEAEERLTRVPHFVRSMVRRAAEEYALSNNFSEITPGMMEELKQKTRMGGMGGHRQKPD